MVCGTWTSGSAWSAMSCSVRCLSDRRLTQVYHGPRPQRSSLPILLDVLHDFLDLHPTETFILCLKEESPPFHPQFSSLVYSYFKPHADRWFLHNRIPKLGEVRGKGILMTRFPDGNKDWIDGLGIHPYTWPDSRRQGFEWDCEGTRFRIQDWYRVPTFLEIPEKFQVVSWSPFRGMTAAVTHARYSLTSSRHYATRPDTHSRSRIRRPRVSRYLSPLS